MPARATETAAPLLAASLPLPECAPVTPISPPCPPRLGARASRPLFGRGTPVASALTNKAGETPALRGKGRVRGPFSQEQPLHPALHLIAVQEGKHRRLQYIAISGAERRERDEDVAAVVESDRQDASLRPVRYAIDPASA